MTPQLRVVLFAALLLGAGYAASQIRDQPSPAQAGQLEDSIPFQEPRVELQQVRQGVPLRVESFDVLEVAEGSDWGNPGDLLVTFMGQGFQVTAKAPRVILSGEVAAESTEVNRDGTELYALIVPDLARRIERLRFDTVVVANPGALQDPETARTAVALRPEQLLRPVPGAPKVRLQYRDGAFSREQVRQ